MQKSIGGHPRSLDAIRKITQENSAMPKLLPDQSFYPSPKMAIQAPSEKFAYVALLNGDPGSPDAIAVVDLDPASKTYSKIINQVKMPNPGDELHHFGWNACSSCLCPYASHPHMERRFLVVPGLRSSRIHILDTKPDPREPKLVKVIEPEEVKARSGYSRAHTSHCGPDGIYMNALGSVEGKGPGGIFVLDPQTFEVKGAWEVDRGPQYLAYDFWWHLGHDTMITSEWGTPDMVENGVNPELLLAGKYGHALHVWDLHKRRHQQVLDMGPEYQMALELRPAHDPTEAYGFVGVVTSLKDLSSSIWLWHHEGSKGNGVWKIRKVIDIPAEAADPELLPPLLKGFKAVPPLVTDINLSLDDRFLYVSCWGTGELRQYDVSDPFSPVLTGSVALGGIVRGQAHPSQPDQKLNGGPQMVEISRDGKRVFVTNSLYRSWDEQFYPDGIRGWLAMLDTEQAGGIRTDGGFFLQTEGFRPHQVRLQGGDASSDSYCFA
jgi:methanethiol oxidase